MTRLLCWASWRGFRRRQNFHHVPVLIAVGVARRRIVAPKVPRHRFTAEAPELTSGGVAVRGDHGHISITSVVFEELRLPARVLAECPFQALRVTFHFVAHLFFLSCFLNPMHRAWKLSILVGQVAFNGPARSQVAVIGI